MWQSVCSGVKWWKVSNGLREHVPVSVQWSEYCSVVKDCRQRTWVMRFRRRCIQHDLAAPVLSWCTRSTTSPAQKCDRRIILHPLTQPSVLWHCWLGVRKSIWPVKIEWWVWLSVWSDVQIVCTLWSSWCYCIPKPHHLLPYLNPDWFYHLSGTDPGCSEKEADKQV